MKQSFAKSWPHPGRLRASTMTKRRRAARGIKPTSVELLMLRDSHDFGERPPRCGLLLCKSKSSRNCPENFSMTRDEENREILVGATLFVTFVVFLVMYWRFLA